MQIWVDADACPKAIKEILFRAAERTGITTTLVANQYLPTPPSRYIRFLQVRSGFDVADNEIVNKLNTGDLVITGDISLAYDVIMKGGHAINPRGERYTQDNIKELLSMHLYALYSAIIEDKVMNKEIKMCGPSFITKHLYFLGKSSGTASYPLIFDSRVAGGLVKMSLTDSACLGYVSIERIVEYRLDRHQQPLLVDKAIRNRARGLFGMRPRCLFSVTLSQPSIQACKSPNVGVGVNSQLRISQTCFST